MAHAIPAASAAGTSTARAASPYQQRRGSYHGQLQVCLPVAPLVGLEREIVQRPTSACVCVYVCVWGGVAGMFGKVVVVVVVVVGVK